MKIEQHTKALIIKVLSGTATRAESRAVERWAEQSQEHRRTLTEWRSVWDASAPPFEVTDEDVDRACQSALKKIRAEKEGKRDPEVRRLRAWQGVAALLAIGCLAAAGTLLLRQQPVQPARVYAAVPEVRVVAPNATRTRVVLPDSSVVWLTSRSELSFPARFTECERRVALSGEAYFDVRSDRSNPFVVETASVDVVATGTSFNVEAYQDVQSVNVILVEGRVGIADGKTGEGVDLKAGSMASIDVRTRIKEVKKVNTKELCGWKDGLLTFRDASLREVFDRLERLYDVEIEFDDPVLSNSKLRATFRDESLDEILKLIRRSTPIAYTDTERRVLSDGTMEKRCIRVTSTL